MQEAFGWERRQSALLCGAMLLGFGLPIILLWDTGIWMSMTTGWNGGVGDFRLIETIVFAWILAMRIFAPR